MIMSPSHLRPESRLVTLLHVLWQWVGLECNTQEHGQTVAHCQDHMVVFKDFFSSSLIDKHTLSTPVASVVSPL